MKIDSEGRPSITNTRTDKGDLIFNAELGSYAF